MQPTHFSKVFITLSQAAEYYQRLGYDHIFMLDNLHDRPEDWCITGFYRFEGAANPSDNSILYLLHKKDGSAKGLLVNAYGIYSSTRISQFLEKVARCHDS